jgi:hypothetical protein
VFGNGLEAHVTTTGRLISVLGSPVANLPTAAAKPSLSAAKAREFAVSNVGRSAKAATARTASGARRATTFRGGDLAGLVYFQTPGGLRLAWQTMTAPSTAELYQHVVDATTGRTLRRRSLVNDDGSGLAWDNYPGAPRAATRSGGPSPVCRTTPAPGRQRRARLQRRQRRQRRTGVRGDRPDRFAPVRLPVRELQLAR